MLSWIAADESLALEEVVFAALLLAIAGHETTANLVGTAVAMGQPRGDAWASDVLRSHTPVQAVMRVATERHPLSDIVVAPGDQVIVGIAAANYDPRVAGGSDALSFGSGRHHCIGARLAMVELEEIVGAIARRGPVEVGDVVWNTSRTICGPARLPVVFTPT